MQTNPLLLDYSHERGHSATLPLARKAEVYVLVKSDRESAEVGRLLPRSRRARAESPAGWGAGEASTVSAGAILWSKKCATANRRPFVNELLGRSLHRLATRH